MKLKLLTALIMFCGLVTAEKPYIEWAKSAGGSSDDLSQSVAIDANHNVYVAGNFSSTSIKFGTFTLTNSNAGNAHVFVAKYDSLGNVLWAKSSENNESGYALSVSSDPDGNVFVSGFFKTSTITFGTFKIYNDTPELYGKLFLVKYDASGNVLWAKSSSNTLWSNAMYSLSADKFGNVYATGHFQDSSITFGSITLNNNSSEFQDVFIVKYNSVGTVLWAKNFGGISHDVGNSVSVDNLGNVLITGNFFSPTISFGSAVLNNKGTGTDVFIAKYDALGNFLWAKSAGGTATDVGSSVTVDQTGNVYVGGLFKSSSIAFGNGITLTKPSNGYINDYLVKYNASGAALWAKTCINTTGNDGINSLTTDKFGNVYSTGSFESPTITFDTVRITNSSPNLQDIFITKYNTTGTLLWAKGFGGTGNELGKSISADTNNRVYLAGQFSSATTAFDSNVLTNTSSSADVFVARILSKSEPDSITLNYCAADSIATLVAYDGYSTYSWLDSNGNIVGASKTLSIKNPVDSSTYICNMTSLDNSIIKHHVTILKYEAKADFSFQNNCKSNTVQFNDLSTFTRGTLNYKWNFGDGEISTEKNPQHTFSTSGIHTVSLELSNPPSTCSITHSKSLETFVPDLVGIDGDLTYCKGKTTVLKAHGASGYTWITGSKADNIEVGTPGSIWLIGNSSIGCLTDTIRCIINEEPDWTLETEGNTFFCEGDSTELIAAGADNYEWNTGAKTNSITVKKAGTYSVVGRSASGCEQSRSFEVTEILFSTANFSVSSLTVDRRHNVIECSVPSLLDVEYSWDMGDGTIKTGSSINHSYNVSNSLLEYIITLTATNKYGCKKTLSKKIDVIPFIPNVFTPNGDGTNEWFMPDVDLIVLDRYGILLYKGTDGWDGTFKGKKADPDVYFYYINYKDKFQQVKTKKGSVTLVR